MNISLVTLSGKKKVGNILLLVLQYKLSELLDKVKSREGSNY